MGFLDSIMEVASQAKEKANQMLADYDKKKAEQAAAKLKMEQKAEEYKNSIIDKITQSNISDKIKVFDGISNEELIKFTKDFAEKLFLPANSSSATNIIMHPYIGPRQLKNIKLTFPIDENTEIPLIHFKTRDKQEVLFTRVNMYFKIAFPEDNRFFSVGSVPSNCISSYFFEPSDEGYVFKCNNFELVKFNLDKAYKQDFITLNDYFARIKNKQFEITDQEINELIKEKIGNDIYREFKKYFTYDDEISIFFAWGCDSITAKDYIICTNKQIIIMNRELMGTTANAKQFYYEDITSIQTIQNSNSNETFTGYLLSSAIVAALDICDLLITVAGASNRINSLYKNEADRVVSIYHQRRKEIKSSEKPTVIQQASEVDPLEQLQKLAKLKESGIISEEEYNEKKAVLLDKI